jgi:nicotinamidase-related amidase
MKTLLVIDMQNDFIDGALGTAEAVSIVEAVKEKILARQAEGWQILYTRDTHGEDYLTTPEDRSSL